MANCVYIYHGQTFSEIELNDFLLSERDKLYSKYGDVVFLKDSVILARGILDDIKVEVAKYLDAYRNAKRLYPDGEDDPNFEAPYVGVTGFLKGLTNNDDQLLTPEFREFEYWTNRRTDWRNGTFNNDEQDLFGSNVVITDNASDSEIQKFLDNWEDETKRNQAMNSNQILKMIGETKIKWETQGKMGTAIHAILQKCFTTIESGPDKGKLFMDVPNKLQLQINHWKLHNTHIASFITDDQIRNCIDYALKLKNELKVKLGDLDLLFFPEFSIATKLSEKTNGADTVLGIIDLLILDSKGNVHTLDYKATPKNEFNSAKQRGFWYQQGMYARMLLDHGLSMNSITPKVMIAPIRMENFRKEGDKFVFDRVLLRDVNMISDITNESTLREVARNLDQFIPIKRRINLANDDILKNMEIFSRYAFPEINTSKQYTDEDISKIISRNGGIEHDEIAKKYTIKINNKTFEANESDGEIKVFEKVKDYFVNVLPRNREDEVQAIVNLLRQGIQENTANIDWPRARGNNLDVDPEWLSKTLGKYCRSDYKVIDEIPALKAYGVIAIENINSHQIDFVKISTNDLDLKNTFNKGRTLLTGAFSPDEDELLKQDSLVMQAYTGNIELMEMMALINCMPELTKNGGKVGELLVANPYLVQGMAAGSNEELLYNFNAISAGINAKLIEENSSDKYENNIKEIDFANKLELASLKLHQIMDFGDYTKWEDPLYKHFHNWKNLMTELDKGISENDRNITLGKLNELRKNIELWYGSRIKPNNVSYNENDNIARSVYNKVLLAIAEVQGVNFRQQVKDNSNIIESMAIHKNGVQSLWLDNPGNLNNKTLDLLTELATNAYQNIREDVGRKAEKTRELLKKLKNAKGFNKLLEMSTGNATDLFAKMIKDTDDDLLFVDPDDPSAGLIKEERDFLNFVLESINSERFPDNDIEEMRKTKDVRYFRVPLAPGSIGSLAQEMGGLFNAVKYKLGRLNPKVWWEDMQRKLVGVFNEVDASKDHSDLFKMTNMFEAGERDLQLRQSKIKEYRKDKTAFERNLETLVLKHTMAYSMKHHIDNVMPMAKAAMIHLNVQSLLGNKHFDNAEKYIENYLKNKIKGESLVDEKFKGINAFLTEARSAASFLALAFSPVSYGYLILQGFWTDIRLMFQYAGTDTPFTWDNFLAAGKIVYQDLFKMGNKPTKCSLLNEMFGLNDMDTNVYAEKLSSDQYGIFNFSNIAYHCASRPDYFNRMMILVATMLHDKTWDCYEFKDGKLKYNFKADPRFSDLLSGSGPNYEYLKGLYFAMALQFEREGAMNPDGSKFIPDYKHPEKAPLPRAYTNKEMESIKSLTDDIYGYYSHEKKSMVHALTWGALWIQMRTYWSGKKNQYLGAPGTGLKGKFEPAKDANGVELFWIMDDQGRLKPVTSEEVGDLPKIPIVKWNRDWLEGILITTAKLFKSSDIKENWDNIWNYDGDPKLRKLYRANLKLLLYDLLVFFLFGSLIAGQLSEWDLTLLKEAKKSGDVGSGALATGFHIGAKIWSSSLTDLNFIDSIGTPVTSWTPFMVSYFTNKLGTASEVLTGDKSIISGLTSLSSATSTFKPFFSVLTAS